jgi:hypothetical protein
MTQLNAIVPAGFTRQVYNGTGGTLDKGTFVKLKAASAYMEVEAAAANDDPVYGVLMNDVPTATYGDCQIAGKALVLAGGTIAEGARVMPTTGAKSLTATVGLNCTGIACTAGVASALHEVELGALGGAEMPG